MGEHLELGRRTPDSRVASLMVQAYTVAGAVRQGRDRAGGVALDRESAGAYTQLAVYAYQANQMRKGDLARDKALKLTEPDMRETLKGQLESASAQAAQAAAGANPTPAPAPED